MVRPIVTPAPLAKSKQCKGASVAGNKPQYSRLHYWQCALAGALSCSTSHSLMVPLDVVKTRIQTDLAMGHMTLPAAFQSIVAKGGVQALLQGLTAVYSGYFVQGAAKFGFYEVFKHRISAALEEAGVAVDATLRLPVYVVASGLAEIIASVALTPMEVTKIDMMTNPLSKSKGMLPAMSAIVRSSGVRGLFRGLPLIMLRQVPYTCVKLAGYDIIIEKLRRRFAPEEADNWGGVGGGQEATAGAGGGGSRGSSSGSEKGAYRPYKRKDLQLLAGILAGVLAATISHPADVVLSKLCGGTAVLTDCVMVQSPADLAHILRRLGLKGSFKGLKARAIMTAAMTAGQFIIYEDTKQKIQAFDWGKTCHKICGSGGSVYVKGGKYSIKGATRT